MSAKRTRASILRQAKKDPAFARELDTTRAIMTDGKKTPTPELDKMAAVKDQSQKIGEFLDWLLDEKKVELAFYHRHGESCDGFNKETGAIEPEYTCAEEAEPMAWGAGHKHDTGTFGCHPERVFGCDLPCQSLTPFRFTPEKLLAEFFEIDLDKIEDERRAILESLRRS